jgi:hypothetical protein
MARIVRVLTLCRSSKGRGEVANERSSANLIPLAFAACLLLSLLQLSAQEEVSHRFDRAVVLYEQ